jgi:hypothetical protein
VSVQNEARECRHESSYSTMDLIYAITAGTTTHITTEHKALENRLLVIESARIPVNHRDHRREPPQHAPMSRCVEVPCKLSTHTTARANRWGLLGTGPLCSEEEVLPRKSACDHRAQPRSNSRGRHLSPPAIRRFKLTHYPSAATAGFWPTVAGHARS